MKGTLIKVIVIGGGGHAKVVISILKKLSPFSILGYLDVADKGKILGVKYFGNDSILKDIRKKNQRCAAVIGVGNVSLSHPRKDIYKRLKDLQFELPAIISPQAIVNEDVRMGEGTVVMDGAVINSGTTIGQAAIINTHSSIDHDCVIGDFVHIAPGVVLSGGVKIGKNCLVSCGSQVIQSVTIGDNCLIGAGATVVENCIEPGVYLGTPAKRKV